MTDWLDRNALAQLTLARLREFYRQPEAIFWTFVFPIVLALALGIAFRDGGTAPIQVGVRAGAEAEGIVASLESGGDIDAEILPAAAVGEALRDGEVALVVVPGDTALTYRYDPSRQEARVARLAADNVLQRAAGRTDPRATIEEPVNEEGGRYIDFLIPGLLGLNLLGAGLWGVGHTIVRMRTGKLLKRFVATPMSRGEFLFSFMLARLAFLPFEVGALLLFAWLVFDVTVQGTLIALAVISALGAFSFSALGLLLASRARTTEAVMGLVNLVSIPMWVLSGVFFSSENFPDIMQPFIEALPLTALVDAFRAVMLDGLPILATGTSLSVLIAWGVGSFGLALAMFRWR